MNNAGQNFTCSRETLRIKEADHQNLGRSTLGLKKMERERMGARQKEGNRERERKCLTIGGTRDDRCVREKARVFGGRGARMVGQPLLLLHFCQ